MSKIFMIGIKGAGMSALANILHDLGHEISGSDIVEHVFTEDLLRKNNIDLYPFAVENVANNTFDIIIRGNAFHPDNNIEVAYLTEHKQKMVSYYDFLAQFLTTYTSIGISGTHGKTTTTGLLVQAMQDKDIAYLIGDGTGYADTDASYFIFEACEYKRHFLSYKPDYLIVTNIDFDHPDYFADTDDVIDAFVSAANQVQKKVIAFGDDIHVQKMLSQLTHQSFYTYGLTDNNDYYTENYQSTTQGVTFDLFFQGTFLHHFSLPFFGQHMILNALSTIVVGHLENISWSLLEQNLQQFDGVKRRFNIETVEEYLIVDDYAHHPTEIKATLDAAKQQYPDKELVIVFQPHTFSRMNSLLDEFANVLEQGDHTYITDVFTSARESGSDVYPTALLELIPGSKYLNNDNIETLLKHQNAVLIFMGAGNIQDYIEQFKNLLNNK